MVTNNYNSPLESLAAFAIVLATGIISTVAIGAYVEKVRRDAHADGRAEGRTASRTELVA